MTPSSRRQWIKRCVDVLTRSRARSPKKPRRETWRPTVEHLEDRLAPSAVSWTGNAGTLNWGDMNNWSNNAVPTSADDVTINKSGVGTINLSGSAFNVRTLNDTTAALSIASGASLSLAAVAATSTFGQNVTVASGATLAVGANVSVLVQPNVTLTDNGTATFGSGDAVTFNNAFQAAQHLVVGGVLSATATTFGLTGSYYNSTFEVLGGGHLQASGSTFALNWLQLDAGSVLGAGDLTGNAFDLPLYLPATYVQYLSGAGSNNLRFQDIDVLSGTLTAGQTFALNVIGTGTTANLRYVFPGNFTVASGATITVAPNVSVLVQSGVTFTDNGTATFGSGDAVTFNNAFQAAQHLVVGGTGVLSAAATTFGLTGSYYNSTFEVLGGGHLQASGSTFALNWLQLDAGSVLGAGDLTGNAFDLPLYLPATYVQYLSGAGSNNLRFQDIDVLSGTLTAGQTFALNVIGTGTTANLRYVFPGNFTVASGATITVAPNVSVLVQSGVTFTDNGTATFGSGDAVTFNNAFQAAQHLVVGGTGVLSAAATTFGLTGSYYNSTFEVLGGGHLQASGSTFALNWLQLDAGSVLGAGDLTGNAFDLPLYLPATYVQYLSGSGSNNLRFQDIDVLSGTLTAGQTFALNVIGTGTTANLRYVFPGNFTVAQGATVTVAPNVSVLVQSGVTFTDNGTVTFGSGDAVTFNNAFQAAQHLVVGGTGVLSATATTFGLTGSYYNSTFEVLGGGHLQASGSTFALNWLQLDAGSVLGAGDLTGNAFDLPLYLPATYVQYLSGSGSNNLRFQDIDVLSGTLASGTVALNVIGTGTTANLRYVFPGNFTVASGATITVAPNVSVLVQSGVTFTDNGTVTFGSGDAVTFNNAFQAAQHLVVGGTGVLSATATTFGLTGSYYNSAINIASGGRLQATNSTFALSSLNLNANSNDTLSTDVISNTFAIDSGATISISGNDFSNIGTNGVVATGDPNATISLINNYWGTTVPANIAAKILDHAKDATRPTVAYNPFLNSSPGAITGLAFNDVNGNGVQDGGEPGLGGVFVYLDANRNGVFDAGEPNTVTNSAGQFSFSGLAPGTYVVRESTPVGSVETDPSASALATTIYFDGTGGEAGITGAGISNFTYHAASFSGGTIFAPSQAALYASGTLAYNASSGSAEVDFSQPVSSVSFFYVHGFGFAAGTATAYGADGSVLGTVGSKAATTNGDPNNFVTLGGFAQPVARITFSGGVIDNFTFTTAANNQAYFARVAAGQTVGGPAFGLTSGSNSGTLPIVENFDDGIAHYFSPQSGTWAVNAGRYGDTPTAVGADTISTLLVNGALPANLEFDVTMNAAPAGNYYSNGFIIFDYQSPTNFKYAGAYVGLKQWVIGHRDVNGWENDAVLNDASITPGTDYNLQLLLQGDNVSLLANGTGKVGFAYTSAFTGSVGLGTQNSVTQFDNLAVQQQSSGTLPIQENFDDGVAHYFSPQSGTWSVSAGRYGDTPSSAGADTVSTLLINGALPSSLEFDVLMNAAAPAGGYYSNGFIIFDYQSATNFKFAGAYVGSQQWVIGHRDANGWEVDAVFADSGIATGTDYNLQLLLQGTKTTLLVNGLIKTSFAYSSAFTGSVGLGTANSLTKFDNLTVQQYNPQGAGTLPIVENFDDGIAHYFIPQSGGWSVSAGRYGDTPSSAGADTVSTLLINGALPNSLEFDVTMNAAAASGNFYSNGFIIFDYQSPTNFKYAGAFVGSQQWVIGHRDANGWENDAVLSDASIKPGTDFNLQTLLQGSDVSLLVNGVSKVSTSYASGFTGSIGLGTVNSLTKFDNLTVQQYNPPGGGNLPIQQNFDDGVAHFFSPQTGGWAVNAGRYGDTPSSAGADTVSTLLINGGAPSSLEFDVLMNAAAPAGSYYSNGFVIFDYQSPTNFKYAGAFVGSQQWVIGHRDANGWENDAVLGDASIKPGTDFSLQLLLRGNSASLLVGGVSKVSHTYAAAFSGAVGLGTQNSLTQFDNLNVQQS